MGLRDRFRDRRRPDYEQREIELTRELESEREGRACRTTSHPTPGRDVECVDPDGSKVFGEAKMGKVHTGDVKHFGDTCEDHGATGVMKVGEASGPAREEAERRGIDLRGWEGRRGVFDRFRR